MNSLRRKILNWIEKNEFAKWKSERNQLDIIYKKIDAQKLQIAERAFNVTFAGSIRFQKKLDLFITGLGLFILLSAGFFVLTKFSLSMMPNIIDWTIFLIAPFILFLNIIGILVLGMYLSVFLIPFANVIRFFAARLSARLSFLLYLRSLNT
jgi:hypothetical protein